MDDYLQKIDNWNDQEIRLWLINGLKYYSFHPMPIHVKDHPTNDLISFCNDLMVDYDIKAERVIDKIKEQLLHLTLEFDYRLISINDFQRDFDFFSNLLILVEKFKIYKIIPNLIKKVESGLYENIRSRHGEDLHKLLLRTIFGFHDIADDRIKKMCLQQFQKKKYSTLCYNYLWELDPDNGILQLPLLIKSYLLDTVNHGLFESFELYLDIHRFEYEDYIYNKINDTWFVSCFESKETDVLFELLVKYNLLNLTPKVFAESDLLITDHKPTIWNEDLEKVFTQVQIINGVFDKVHLNLLS